MSDKSAVEDLKRISASTGFSWLNAIPSHWRLQQLRYIADIRFSNVDKKSDENELLVKLCNYTDVYYNRLITSQIDFMEATATQEEIQRFGLRAGDVLVTKDSESWSDIAIPAYVPETLPDVICGYHLALIRPNDIQLGRYLAWAFASSAIAYQFNIAASGITRYGLSQQAIKDAWFPIPPLVEQRAIADFLDRETAKIDALITHKQRLLELLAERRQALITHAVTKGLNPDAPMKDSEIEWLGEMPSHWFVMPLRQVLASTDYGISTNLSGQGQFKVLTMGHISNGKLTIPSEGCLEEKPDVILSHHDLVFNRTNSLEQIGKVGIFEGQEEDNVSIASYLVRLRVNPRAHPKYLNYLLNSEWMFAEGRSRALPSINQANLNPNRYTSIAIPVPPIDEQKEIASFLDDKTTLLERLAEEIQAVIERLQERRAVLINEVVTGKMKVTG